MENNSLYHHGIKGMRWGVRRYQNKNGTLTRAGRKRYANKENEKPKLTPEEERELKKSQVLESRSAKQLYDNRKMFNYDEMSRAHKLLKLDDDVKKLIVEEPSKVSKFLTKAGDLANKIKGVVEPTVAIYKELEKLSGESSNKKNNTANTKTKNNEEVDDKSNDNSTKNGGGVKGMKWGKREKTDDNINVDNNVDFSPYGDTYTKSSNTTVSYVASLMNSSYGTKSLGSAKVTSLPDPSSETKALITNNIAGYLPGPKEDD